MLELAARIIDGLTAGIVPNAQPAQTYQSPVHPPQALTRLAFQLLSTLVPLYSGRQPVGGWKANIELIFQSGTGQAPSKESTNGLPGEEQTIHESQPFARRGPARFRREKAIIEISFLAKPGLRLQVEIETGPTKVDWSVHGGHFFRQPVSQFRDYWLGWQAFRILGAYARLIKTLSAYGQTRRAGKYSVWVRLYPLLFPRWAALVLIERRPFDKIYGHQPISGQPPPVKPTPTTLTALRMVLIGPTQNRLYRLLCRLSKFSPEEYSIDLQPYLGGTTSIRATASHWLATVQHDGRSPESASLVGAPRFSCRLGTTPTNQLNIERTFHTSRKKNATKINQSLGGTVSSDLLLTVPVDFGADRRLVDHQDQPVRTLHRYIRTALAKSVFYYKEQAYDLQLDFPANKVYAIYPPVGLDSWLGRPPGTDHQLAFIQGMRFSLRPAPDKSS